MELRRINNERIIASLENKRDNGTWINRISDDSEEYNL